MEIPLESQPHIAPADDDFDDDDDGTRTEEATRGKPSLPSPGQDSQVLQAAMGGGGGLEMPAVADA